MCKIPLTVKSAETENLSLEKYFIKLLKWTKINFTVDSEYYNHIYLNKNSQLRNSSSMPKTHSQRQYFLSDLQKPRIPSNLVESRLFSAI